MCGKAKGLLSVNHFGTGEYETIRCPATDRRPIPEDGPYKVLGHLKVAATKPYRAERIRSGERTMPRMWLGKRPR